MAAETESPDDQLLMAKLRYARAAKTMSDHHKVASARAINRLAEVIEARMAEKRPTQEHRAHSNAGPAELMYFSWMDNLCDGMDMYGRTSAEFWSGIHSR